MGYWFTGTSTGNVYNVGQSYSMGGDVYVAQMDGTFQNTRTGNSLVGSSQSETAVFGYTGSLTGSGSGSGHGGTTGPGSSAVSSGGGSATTGPGASGAVSSSGGNSPQVDVTPIVVKKSGAGTSTGAGWLSVENKDLQRIGLGGPQEAAGAISDIGWVKTQGGWSIVPSSDMKERMEDSVLLEMPWAVRNMLGPQLGIGEVPFPNFLGDRKNYQFNSFTNEWQPLAGTVPNVGGGF